MLPEALAAQQSTRPPAARQAILVFLQGGQSHLDTWDLKPEAPADYRGEFAPIATAVPGYFVCEHLPRLATRADKYNVLRSVYHQNPGHEGAIHWSLTGYDHPEGNVTTKNVNTHPSVGSLVSKIQQPNREGLLPYVCIPHRGQLGDRVRYASAAYLGMTYDPFESGATPDTATAPFAMPPNLSLTQDLDLRRMDGRLKLLQDLDRIPRALDASGSMAGLDRFNRRAVELLAHTSTRDAFDMSQEPVELRQRYGNANFAQRLVLARRLAEAGVNFTLVNFSDNQDWDTHADGFQTLKQRRLPEFDQALSALLDDLEARGLLETTLVAVFGEFGRTPKINGTAGRDHWSNVYSAVLAGGGLKRGLVLGASTARGEEPHDRPIHFTDVLATIYRQIGVPTDRSFPDHFGRPVPVLSTGQPIAELL